MPHLPSTSNKSITTSYLLWAFGGLFALHRFYLRRVVSGAIMLGMVGLAAIFGFGAAFAGSGTLGVGSLLLVLGWLAWLMSDGLRMTTLVGLPPTARIDINGEVQTVTTRKAYGLWCFLGGLGVHRFALGRPALGYVELGVSILYFAAYVAKASSLAINGLGLVITVLWVYDLFQLRKWLR